MEWAMESLPQKEEGEADQMVYQDLYSEGVNNGKIGDVETSKELFLERDGKVRPEFQHWSWTERR